MGGGSLRRGASVKARERLRTGRGGLRMTCRSVSGCGNCGFPFGRHKSFVLIKSLSLWNMALSVVPDNRATFGSVNLVKFPVHDGPTVVASVNLKRKNVLRTFIASYISFRYFKEENIQTNSFQKLMSLKSGLVQQEPCFYYSLHDEVK